MGAGGLIQGMINTLKMNDRRKLRTHFDKELGFKIKKTKYDLPTLTEQERKHLVERIMRKQKERTMLAYIISPFLVFLILFLLFSGCS